jgi:hypothetical protein
MDFLWRYILGGFLTGAIFLLGYLIENTKKLKKKIKENFYLEDENNKLKKIILDLNDEKQFLKEIVIAFKSGKITRDKLVEQFQILIFKEDEERAIRKAQKLKNKIKVSEIFGIDLKEKD